MNTPHHAPVIPRHLVEPLCKPFAKEADCILDLYSMTQQPGHPGKCVQCFFKLLGKARPMQEQALHPLKDWIESNLEIAVEASDHSRATLPVHLQAPSLESFCASAMERVRYDTAIRAERVRLELRFRQQPSAA